MCTSKGCRMLQSRDSTEPTEIDTLVFEKLRLLDHDLRWIMPVSRSARQEQHTGLQHNKARQHHDASRIVQQHRQWRGQFYGIQT